MDQSPEVAAARDAISEKICPFLGLVNDPATSAAYARVDHRCRLPGVDPPDLRWQAHYCLVAEHIECPHYRAAQAEGTTAVPTMPAKVDSRTTRRRRFAVAGVALLIVVALLVLVNVYAGNAGSWEARVRDHFDTTSRAPAVTTVASSSHDAAGNSQLSRGSGGAAGIAASPVVTSTAAPVASLPSPTTAVVPTPTLAPLLPNSGGQLAGPGTSTAPRAPAASPKLTPTPSPPEPATYTVQSGDTLDALAQRFHTTVDAIATLNNIPDPNQIMAGQVLKLPSPVPAPSATTAP